MGMVANTCEIPHIVHGPHQSFASLGQSLNRRERQHALVYPIQTHNIGLLHPWVFQNIISGTRHRHLKHIGAVKTVIDKYIEMFFQEQHFLCFAATHLAHIFIIGCLGTDYHACIDTSFAQCVHESACHHRCTSKRVAMIDQYNFE